MAILVNNAGSSTGSSLLTGDPAAIRLEMDTHFFGTLTVTRAFAPQLAAHLEHHKRTGRSHLFRHSDQNENWPAWYIAGLVVEHAGTGLPA